MYVVQFTDPYTNKPTNYYFPPLRFQNESSHNSAPAKYRTDEADGSTKRQRAQEGTSNKQSPNIPPDRDWEDSF